MGDGLTFSKIGIMITGNAMEANRDSSPMVILTNGGSQSNHTILRIDQDSGSDCLGSTDLFNFETVQLPAVTHAHRPSEQPVYETV